MKKQSSFPSIRVLLDLAGLRDGFDAAELAKAAARGVPVDIVEGLKGWMPPGVVSRSIASASTLSRRQRKGGPLIGAEADRALRVVAILAKAVNVFGDDEKARRWLSKPKAVLDPTGAARSPYELLGSEHGARLVEQRLVQIDHGMYA